MFISGSEFTFIPKDIQLKINRLAPGAEMEYKMPFVKWGDRKIADLTLDILYGGRTLTFRRRENGILDMFESRHLHLFEIELRELKVDVPDKVVNDKQLKTIVDALIGKYGKDAKWYMFKRTRPHDYFEVQESE